MEYFSDIYKAELKKMKTLLNYLYKIIKFIDSLLAKIWIFIIYIYQKTISPDKGLFSFFLKGKVCSHAPHCSQYGLHCLQRYGFREWIPKISDRILHCLPSMQKIYDPAHYRVVFVSSAQIGIPFLEELVNDQRFAVVGVVSQPDKPVWRGLTLQENIIKTKAKELQIPEVDIQTPTKINPEKSIEGKNFFDRLAAKKPDFLVVIAYGKIIPQMILDIPTFWPINVHGSLLPKYRGASPIQTIFLNKESKSWITIMHMDAGMDTWDIISQRAFPLPFDWTCLHCIEHMQKIWPMFLTDSLRNYAKGKIKTVKQDGSKVINCKKIEKADWEVDVFNESLDTIYAKYRAYYLWPKIFFHFNGKKIIIEKLRLDEKLFTENKDKTLFAWNQTLNQCVEELILKPEGKKAIDRPSFRNWYLKEL